MLASVSARERSALALLFIQVENKINPAARQGLVHNVVDVNLQRFAETLQNRFLLLPHGSSHNQSMSPNG
jgi:hypothetical protein